MGLFLILTVRSVKTKRNIRDKRKVTKRKIFIEFYWCITPFPFVPDYLFFSYPNLFPVLLSLLKVYENDYLARYNIPHTFTVGLPYHYMTRIRPSGIRVCSFYLFFPPKKKSFVVQ